MKGKNKMKSIIKIDYLNRNKDFFGSFTLFEKLLTFLGIIFMVYNEFTNE